jgi:hypothetical protein
MPRRELLTQAQREVLTEPTTDERTMVRYYTLGAEGGCWGAMEQKRQLTPWTTLRTTSQRSRGRQPCVAHRSSSASF